MKLRKEVLVCDECNKGDNFTIATCKCKICNCDLCEDCGLTYQILFGDYEEDYGYTDYNFICCKKCIKKFHITQRKDKKFLKDMVEKTIHYAKQKVMLKEIEK